MTKRHHSAEESFDWELCVLCQEKTQDELLCPAAINRINHVPEKAYNDILSNLQRFTELGNLPFEKIYIPDDYSSNSDIFVEKKGKFHKSCRNKINDMKLKRAEKRTKLTDNSRIPDESNERRRSGRTSQINVKNIKRECFFCVEEGGNLHKASTFKLHNRVLCYAKLLEDTELLGKLSEGDMMAQDALYHSDCLIKL